MDNNWNSIAPADFEKYVDRFTDLATKYSSVTITEFSSQTDDSTVLMMLMVNGQMMGISDDRGCRVRSEIELHLACFEDGVSADDVDVIEGVEAIEG